MYYTVWNQIMRQIGIQNQKLPKSISAKELNELLNSAEKIQIIDIREHFEWDICHIEGALNIPMNLIIESIDKISKDVTTVIICHHGTRSMKVINYLESIGYKNLINLDGGIHAWSTDVDKTMSTY